MTQNPHPKSSSAEIWSCAFAQSTGDYGGGLNNDPATTSVANTRFDWFADMGAFEYRGTP